jgi:hypothetical protein
LSASGNPFVYLPDKFTDHPTAESKKRNKNLGRPIVDLSNNAIVISSQEAATIAAANAAANIASAAKLAASKAATAAAATAATALANTNSKLGQYG